MATTGLSQARKDRLDRSNLPGRGFITHLALSGRDRPSRCLVASGNAKSEKRLISRIGYDWLELLHSSTSYVLESLPGHVIVIDAVSFAR